MRRTQACASRLTDNLNSAQRSHAMRQVKSKNTSLEMLVRSELMRLGFGGYRLHRADLPGKPDIAWIGRKQALFINGCFWHGHDCPRGRRIPATRADYWQSKIARTRERDTANNHSLRMQGWNTFTIWECEISNWQSLEKRLVAFLRR